VLLILSALFGYLAGVTGLTDLVGKTAVAVLGIAAGVATTSAILALTMLKSAAHLSAAGDYEKLFRAAVQLDERIAEDRLRHRKLRAESDRIAEDSRTAGISLSNGQVSRYEKQARTKLAAAAGDDNARKGRLLNQ
jgi:hypothetical protein